MKFTVNKIEWKLYPALNDITAKELFSSFDKAFEVDGEVVSSGQFCYAIRIYAGGRTYYVKRYQAKGMHRWKAFHRCRPVTEYHNYDYFARLGIPVPQIVGYGIQRIMGLFRRGVIITEGVPHATDLDTLMRTRPDLFCDRAWLFQVLQSLADYVRRLHEDGFTHEDLKWRNILATTTKVPSVFLIDCPSGSRKMYLRHKYFLVKDLAGLDRPAARNLSCTTRLRFYLWYRNQSKLTPRDKKLIAKVIARR
jgi:tRNA A-37 threonylcarbamoyl transferase component Bud32